MTRRARRHHRASAPGRGGGSERSRSWKDATVEAHDAVPLGLQSFQAPSSQGMPARVAWAGQRAAKASTNSSLRAKIGSRASWSWLTATAYAATTGFSPGARDDPSGLRYACWREVAHAAASGSDMNHRSLPGELHDDDQRSCAAPPSRL